MLGKTEPYEIPKVQKYNLADAKNELYRNSPSSNYGIRYKFKMEYHKIDF